jgi:hypothetical protein
MVSTEGTNFDTVVYVLNGACQGAELACNDDSLLGLWSYFVTALSQDQEVTIIVDGYDGNESGAYDLSITKVSCTQDVDIGNSAPHQELDNTSNEGDDNVGSCVPGGGGEDLTFKWTAPQDGSYTIDTIGSTFDTVLYVYNGACTQELACNDDEMDLLSEVMVNLSQDDVIYIVVDGFNDQEEGDFTLNIAAN